MPPAPSLDRAIAVDFRGVTVRQALDLIRDSTGIPFDFETAVVSAAPQRVSFHDAHASLGRVLGIVLRGTGLGAKLAADSAIIIAPAAPLAITGRVRDARTGRLLPGATVILDGLWQRATSSDSGTYRLDSVPAGTFPARVRLLGYHPAARTVTIAPGERPTVDFGLEQLTGSLERVVVTGTIVPTQEKELPTPISVITAAEFQTQHYARVDEIFRGSVPGSISWAQGNFDYYSTITVRGINSFDVNNIKTYIDGVEVADFAYAAVDVNSIDHVEVIRGPQASTIYGSDASGGVMQIFTKHGIGAPDRPTLNASIAEGVVQGPDKDAGALQQQYAVSLEGAREGAGYNLGASYRHVGAWLPGYYSSDPGAYGGVHLDQGPLSIQLSARYLQRTFPLVESPQQVATGIPQFAKPQNVTEAEHEQTYGINLNYRASSWWTHNLTIGYDRSETEYARTSPQLTTPTDTLLAALDRSVGKASIAYNTSATWLMSRALRAVATAGFDHYERTIDEFVASGLPSVIGLVPVPSPVGVALLDRDPVSNTGAFGQMQLGVREQLFLTAGIRADRNSGIGPAYGTAVAPRFGLSFVHSVSDVVFKARASYGEGIQPGLPSQHMAQTISGTSQLPNAALAPERQLGGDVGIDVDFGRIGSLSATYYNQQARNLIIQEIVPAGTPNTAGLQYQNLGRIDNRGLETCASAQISVIRLSAEFSYTLSRIANLGPDYNGSYRVGDQAQLVPFTSGGLMVGASPWKGGEIAAGATYIGYWTSQNVLKQDSALAGLQPLLTPRAYLERFPGFVKLRLSVDQQIDRRLSGFLSVDNLANNHAIEQNAAYATPGRTASIGVRVGY